MIKQIILSAMLLPSFAMAIGQGTVFEASFESSKDYENPFLELEVDVYFFKEDPLKPFVSGESCHELHMQQNPAYLQHYQFWALMLAGAAGHTYGAAGIWHMATPEEHGNWGGWDHQPYELTTWKSPNVPSPQDWMLVMKRVKQ